MTASQLPHNPTPSPFRLCNSTMAAVSPLNRAAASQTYPCVAATPHQQSHRKLPPPASAPPESTRLLLAAAHLTFVPSPPRAPRPPPAHRVYQCAHTSSVPCSGSRPIAAS